MLTHHALLQQVWGAAYLGAKADAAAHIANLRRKIDPVDGRRLIQTGHRVGYRLVDSRSPRCVRTHGRLGADADPAAEGVARACCRAQRS